MSDTPFFSLPGMTLDRQRIEVALVAAVDTKDAYLNELARHLIVAGGKRLRPVLTLVAAQAFGRAFARTRRCRVVLPASWCKPDRSTTTT